MATKIGFIWQKIPQVGNKKVVLDSKKGQTAGGTKILIHINEHNPLPYASKIKNNNNNNNNNKKNIVLRNYRTMAFEIIS